MAYGIGAHLTERDFRSLATGVVTCLRANHQITPTDFGVHLMPEGFSFVAVIHGRTCIARTGQGNFEYKDVAKELALLANEKTDRGLEVIELTPPERCG